VQIYKRPASHCSSRKLPAEPVSPERNPMKVNDLL